MKSFIWFSFDLGVQGDYEALYSWLDNHEAKECGDSLACLRFEHSGDLIDALKKDLASHVHLNGRSRLYVIHLANGKMKGTFITGSRKTAPWTGYAVSAEDIEDTDE
ncbi:MAG TPA: hypothetical protein PLI09_23935 [Candidatus Hydrogenedentes bacterium]|nr:hypothetical protein [Candidatus Hydrogenedentota bacterium]